MLSCKLHFDRIILIICLLLFYSGLYAQDNQPEINLNDGVYFEVAPHTGFMGGSGLFGLKLSMNYSSFNLELAGEQVIGNTADMYPLTLNAVLNLTTKSSLIPYGLVGPALFITIPGNTIGDNTVTTVGLNFGGGIRYYLNSTFGLRLEAKQYFTSIKNKRENIEEIMIFQEIALGVTFMLK